MKRYIVALMIVCLLVVSALAQDTLTNTVTSTGGLTAQYPDGYFAEADGDVSIALIDLERQAFIVMGLGGEIIDFTGEEPTTSADARDGFVTMLDTLGGSTGDDPIEEFAINDRPAFLVPFTESFLGDGYVITFELPDGTVIGGMLFGNDGIEFTDDMIADLKAIAGSVTYDETAATVTEEEAEPTMEAEANTEAETGSDIPLNAILLEDMPEGMILTNDGLQMPMPEGFVFPPGTEYVESSVGLFSADFLNTLIVYYETMEDLGGIGTIAQFILPTLAGIGGHEDFDPDEHLQTLEVDERTITYYDSTDFVDDDEIGGVYYFIIELTPEGEAVALVQATLGAGSVEDVEPVLYDFIQQITLSEEAQAEAIKDTIDAQATVECFTPAYNVITAEEPDAVVTCPTNCTDADGDLWGTEIYTNDSSICKAAVHMGVIDDTGGDVAVTHVEGQSAYVSTIQNGIESQAYDEWPDSFSVSVPDSEEEE